MRSRVRERKEARKRVKREKRDRKKVESTIRERKRDNEEFTEKVERSRVVRAVRRTCGSRKSSSHIF